MALPERILSAYDSIDENGAQVIFVDIRHAKGVLRLLTVRYGYIGIDRFG